MWKPKQRKKWADIRAQGRDKFVRKYGIIGWGIPTALAWSLSIAYREGWGELPILLVVGLILFPVGGNFIGRILWHMNEKAYAKASAQQAAK